MRIFSNGQESFLDFSLTNWTTARFLLAGSKLFLPDPTYERIFVVHGS